MEENVLRTIKSMHVHVHAYSLILELCIIFLGERYSYSLDPFVSSRYKNARVSKYGHVYKGALCIRE